MATEPTLAIITPHFPYQSDTSTSSLFLVSRRQHCSSSIFLSVVFSLRAKLSRSTRSAMYGLSHYMFRRRFIHKCRLHKSVVRLVTEEYTSKTCGNCGHIMNHLKNNDLFQVMNNFQYAKHHIVLKLWMEVRQGYEWSEEHNAQVHRKRNSALSHWSQ